VALEYTVLDDRVIIWVHAGDKPAVFTIPADRERLTADVLRFAELLEGRVATDELDELSSSLYDTLIHPVEGVLGGAEWLGVVPDRILHRLPFAALRDSGGGYLVSRFDLVQAPTSGSFGAGAGPAGGGASLVALSPPNADEGMRKELGFVEDTYPGIEAITGYGVDASLFTERINGAGFFVYNGHSVEGTSSLSASIVLNPADPAGTVTALEIAEQRMAPDAIVVLSSCDSSVGNFVGGIEFKGLTSAFMAAGAGAVVGSLWPVASAETADLMIGFHQRVADGQGVASSLAEAQRAMIGDGLHPFYWAGFTVTGNRTALEPAPFVASATAEARLSR
jgi:CHAT domain-containing protein